MFDGIRARFSEYWPHDDSPGFSDHPEVDIKTHRSIAKTLRLIALGVFVAGLVGALTEGEGWPVLVFALAVALLCLWAADNLRLQALEWEIQLFKEGDR